jgi:hypothetical protein
MSYQDVVRAAQQCLLNGDRDAASFLTNTMQESLQNHFSRSGVMDVIAHATSSNELLWEHLTTVHFLLTLLSSFFRRKLPAALRTLVDTARSASLLALLEHVGPRLASLHAGITSSTVAAGMAKRMRACLTDALAMMLLLSSHNIIMAASTFSQRFHSDLLRLDLLTSSMNIIADMSLQLGPICRSANRLALQKRMDVILELPIAAQEASSTLMLCVEFLSNYSTFTPQEQCPAFYDGLAGSQLLDLALNAVVSGSEDACQSIALVLCGLASLEDEAPAEVTRRSMKAALDHGGARIVSTVFNGVLEGPIGDVLLRPELHDLCRWIEDYFLSLARFSSTSDREMLERSVMLLVGGLRPQDVPTIEDDDDEDDMAFVVAEIQESNEKKAACVGRLGEFLSWCTSTLAACGAAAASPDYDALLDAWLTTDPDQWDYDGPDSFEGLARTAAVLERLLALRPSQYQREAVGNNILFWGACKQDDLLRGVLCGEVVLDDHFGSGAAWYTGQLYRRDASLNDAAWRQLWSQLCRQGHAYSALQLLRIVQRTLPVTFTGEMMSEFMSMLQTFQCPTELLRRTVACVQDLQLLQRAEAPMHNLQVLSSCDYGPADVMLGALVCSWVPCASVPHLAIDRCWALLEQMLSEPPDPLSLAENDRLWSNMAVMCSSFVPLNSDHAESATNRLARLLHRGLMSGYRGQLLQLTNAFCRSSHIRRSRWHQALGGLCRDAVAAMTSEDPLPLNEMTQACASGVLFEGGTEWFKDFVVWLLQTHQFLSLFSGAALRLVAGLAEGGNEVARCCEPQHLLPWVLVCDATVRYSLATLCAVSDDVSDEQDQVRHRALQSVSMFLFHVSSRANGEMLSLLQEQSRRLLDGAEDHHEVMHRLRTLWH